MTTRKVSKRSFTKKPKKIAAATPAPAPAPERVPAPAPEPTPEPVWTIDAVSPAPKAAPPAPPPATAPTVSTTSTTSAVVSPAAEAPVTPVKPIAATGLVLEVGPEVVVPATSFAPGGSTIGPGLALDVRAGYYVSSHIGIVAGMRGSFAHHVSSCDGCTGVGFQIPIVVQFAASRTRGAYGEAGVGLLSFYEASKGDVKPSVSTPVVLKVGGGYRIGSPGSSASASIDNPTIHLVVGGGIIGHFAL